MVYSASSVKAEQNPLINNSYYFIERQMGLGGDRPGRDDAAEGHELS